MERDFAHLRDSPEWVFAVVGSTLATGTPNGAGPTTADVAEAAERIVIAFRESGRDHVITSSGVWALEWLDDDDVIALARDVIGEWLDAQGLELTWIGDGGT